MAAKAALGPAVPRGSRPPSACRNAGRRVASRNRCQTAGGSGARAASAAATRRRAAAASASEDSDSAARRSHASRRASRRDIRRHCATPPVRGSRPSPMMRAVRSYRHTQVGWVIIGVTLALAAVFASTNRALMAAGPGRYVVGLFPLLLLLFGTLTVTVEDGERARPIRHRPHRQDDRAVGGGVLRRREEPVAPGLGHPLLPRRHPLQRVGPAGGGAAPGRRSGVPDRERPAPRPGVRAPGAPPR